MWRLLGPFYLYNNIFFLNVLISVYLSHSVFKSSCVSDNIDSESCVVPMSQIPNIEIEHFVPGRDHKLCLLFPASGNVLTLSLEGSKN